MLGVGGRGLRRQHGCQHFLDDLVLRKCDQRFDGFIERSLRRSDLRHKNRRPQARLSQLDYVIVRERLLIRRRQRQSEQDTKGKYYQPRLHRRFSVNT